MSKPKLHALKQNFGASWKSAISKKSRRVLCEGARVKHAFISAHKQQHSVRIMCDVFNVHCSGYYAWLKLQISAREVEDGQLLASIKEHYVASGGTCGVARIHRDLRDAGET